MNVSHDWANIVVIAARTSGSLRPIWRSGSARPPVGVRFESGHAGSASVDSLMAVLNALDLYAEVAAADDGADSDSMFMDVVDPWDVPKAHP